MGWELETGRKQLYLWIGYVEKWRYLINILGFAQNNISIHPGILLINYVISLLL